MRRYQYWRCIVPLVLLGCLLVSASCTPSNGASPRPDTAVSIVFSASVSYADALRELTNLGVQPAVFCGYRSDLDAGLVIQGTTWLPAGQKARFEQDHRMFVVKTIVAAPNWSSKMYGLPGAHRDPLTSTQDISCSRGVATPGASSPSGAPDVLTYAQVGNQIGTYARVIFAASLDYDAALNAVSNLGLRLADPCYEQSLLSQQHQQSWHSMGQEAAFMSSHALVVAPAPMTSAVTWRTQLRTLAGVTLADTTYHPVC